MEIVAYIQVGNDEIGVDRSGRACALVRRLDSPTSPTHSQRGSQGKIDGLNDELNKQIKAYALMKKEKRTNML